MTTTAQLHQLAKMYADSYASPHHITFSLAGLERLMHDAMRIHIATAAPVPTVNDTKTQDTP